MKKIELCEQIAGAKKIDVSNSEGANKADSIALKVISKLKKGAGDSGSRMNLSNASRLWSRLRSRTLLKTTRLLSDEGGIPIRDALQGLYMLRRRRYLGLIIILGLMILLLFTMLHLTIDTRVAFEQEEALRELLVDEEFPGASFKKNYLEIRTVAEWWEWVRGPLLRGIYSPTYYSGRARHMEWIDYTSQVLRVVGGLRFRQNRVRNDSCAERRRAELGSRIDTKAGVCFSE